VELGSLADAADVHFTSARAGYAVASQPGCAAAVVETGNRGSTWDEVTCLGEGRPLAIAAVGDIVAAQVGDGLHVSTDAGGSWQLR